MQSESLQTSEEQPAKERLKSKHEKDETQDLEARLTQIADSSPLLRKILDPEGYRSERKSLELSYDQEIVDICMSAMTKIKSLVRLKQEQGSEFSIGGSFNDLIRKNVEFIEERMVAGKEPFPGYYEGLAEIEKLSHSDIEQVKAEIQKSNLPEGYAPVLQVYFDTLDEMFEGIEDLSLLRHAAQDTKSNLIAMRAVQLLMRQETFLFFPYLAKIDTRDRQSSFEGITKETVDFLCAAFPGLDRSTLEKRADKLSMNIETVIGRHYRWEGVGGRYNSKTHEISIKRENKNKENVYTHEILHGLSQGEIDEPSEFRDSELSKDAARMLTEAVIEELSQFTQVSERNNRDSYVDEREFMLNSLRRIRGTWHKIEIPLAVFVEALFSEKKSLREALTKAGLSQDLVESAFEMLNKDAISIRKLNAPRGGS